MIDSLSGLELALAPKFREDFRESLYRMMGALTELGATVMATASVPDEVEPVKARIAALQTSEHSQRSANHWVTKAGERRWIDWSNTVTRASEPPAPCWRGAICMERMRR